MAKKALNELRWHPSKSLEGIDVTYVHRGAPGDRMRIGAMDISRLEKSFFVLEREGREVMIPYHRIVEISRGGEVIWRKRDA